MTFPSSSPFQWAPTTQPDPGGMNTLARRYAGTQAGTGGMSALEQRFRAMVASGAIDPNDIVDPATGRIRATVWAALGGETPVGGFATSPGYRGPAPAVDANGYEIVNPNELSEDRLRNDLALRSEAQNTANTGVYLDPVTGNRQVTPGYGQQLLTTFGNANTYQDRYRQQVAQAQGQAASGYQNVQQAEAARNQAGQDVRMTGGGYNPTQEQQGAIANANRNVYQAQTAYNALRGQAGQVRQQGVGPDQIAQGMTPEQFGAYAQTVAQGYSPEEMQAIQQNPQQFAKDPRYAQALAYRRANLARGGL